MSKEDASKSSPMEASDPFLSSGFEVTDEMLSDDFEDVYKNFPINEDTACGFWFIRGSFLQK